MDLQYEGCPLPAGCCTAGWWYAAVGWPLAAESELCGRLAGWSVPPLVAGGRSDTAVPPPPAA